MTRSIVIAAMAAALPLAVQAQTWQATATDTGGLIYGTVHAPEYSLSFSCNTQSPQGRPLIETEDHETIRNLPFGIFVSLSAALVSPEAGPNLPSVTVTLDGTGYRLPPLRWDELYGEWMVELAMADPVFAAMAGASDLVLDSGRGSAWRYPTDGLAEGLETAFTACVSGWAQAGFAVPQTLGGAAVQPPIATLLTAEIDQHLRRSCEATYVLDGGAIATHDLDRDGAPDRILDWAGVTCNAAIARPFCGAANCSVDVFLSSRPGDPQSFSGVGYTITQAANGAPGLQFGGTAGDCARGECDRVFWWDGAQFRQ